MIMVFKNLQVLYRKMLTNWNSDLKCAKGGSEMATVQAIVQFFLNLGASVFLPVIIFILAVSFGAKPGRVYVRP